MFRKSKAITLLLALLFLTTPKAHSQEVFEAVLKSATDIVDNPNSDDAQIQIAQFKITTLTYIHRKMVELNPDASAHDLDVQAYYMSVYLTHFLSDVYKLRGASNNTRAKQLKVYIETSKNNPLFNDPDKSIVHAYIGDGESLTPFSIDTNWQKACEILKFE